MDVPLTAEPPQGYQRIPEAITDTSAVGVSARSSAAESVDAVRVFSACDDLDDLRSGRSYSSDAEGESLSSLPESPLPRLSQPSDFTRLYHEDFDDSHTQQSPTPISVNVSSPPLLHSFLPRHEEPILTFSLYSPVHDADDFLTDPTTPTTTSLPFVFSESVMSYVASYFALLNRGLYFFFDEPTFYEQLNETVNDPSSSLASSSLCEGWLMGLCAAVAIGARMQGDCEMADRASSRARDAVRFFHHPVEAKTSLSPCCSSCADIALLSRVAAYRSCLALCYYAAAMDDAELCSQLRDVSNHLIQAHDVRDCIPAAVRMLANLMPNVSAAFTDLGDTRAAVEANTDLLLSTSIASSDRTQSPASPAPTGRNSRVVSSLLTQQAELFPLDRWKYYAVKRALRPQLHDVSDDDPELTMGSHLDSSLHVEVECSTSSLRAELAAINYHLTLIACKTASGGGEEVTFSLWNFLALLLKAEATADVTQLSAHQRVGVLGRQAVCHSMLGNTAHALKAAKSAVGLLSQLHSANPHNVRLPPFAPSFTRCVILVGLLDDSDEGIHLLRGGLSVIEALARLWPSMARVLSELQRQLLSLVDRQLCALNVELHSSKRRLQDMEVDAKGHDESQYVELSDAAGQLVQLSNTIRRLRRKHLVLSPPDVRLSRESSASPSAAPPSPSVSIASTNTNSSSGSGSWTVDSVTDCFSVSLSLEQDPLRTRGISRGPYDRESGI